MLCKLYNKNNKNSKNNKKIYVKNSSKNSSKNKKLKKNYNTNLNNLKKNIIINIYQIYSIKVLKQQNGLNQLCLMIILSSIINWMVIGLYNIFHHIPISYYIYI